MSKHTATENARYIARLYGLDPDYVESFCRWLCGLEEYFDMPLAIYSAGMKARLVFLRWKNALPGHRAFSIYGLSDPRVDMDRIKKSLGNGSKIIK